MRTIADVIGFIVFSLGLVVAFGGVALSGFSTAGSILFSSGLIMVPVGWLISRSPRANSARAVRRGSKAKR